MLQKIYTVLFLFFFLHFFAIEGNIFITNDFAIHDKWNNTLGETTPKIMTTDNVFVNQNIFVSVFFSGYKLDAKSIANVEYSIKVFSPKETLYFSKENVLGINRKVNNSNYLQMCDGILFINFDEKQELGLYRIEIEIFDKVAGSSKKLSSSVTLEKLIPFDSFQISNDKEFMNWMQNYYKNPNPEGTLAHYLYFAKSSMTEKDDVFFSIFSFFKEIVSNNKFILPHIRDSYASQDLKTKIYLIYLLHFSGFQESEFLDLMNNEEKEAYNKIKDSGFNDIYGEINSGTQLDMLWSTFFANGKYKSILKLIQTLDYIKYKGSIENYKNSKKTEEDKQNAYREAVFQAAEWSLSSNCKTFELVKDYANWALYNEDLNENQRKQLKKILDELK